MTFTQTDGNLKFFNLLENHTLKFPDNLESSQRYSFLTVYNFYSQHKERNVIKTSTNSSNPNKFKVL